MPDRPYIDHTIDQLEQLVAKNRDRPAVLGPIRVELEHRKTSRAKQLAKEVLALVEGDIPKPRPPKAGRLTDQGGLFASGRMYLLDDVLSQLDRFRQRATYGAVGELVGQPPIFLMNGRPRDPHNSWVVSKQTGLPTKYEKSQMHPELESRDTILESGEELAHWLAHPG